MRTVAAILALGVTLVSCGSPAPAKAPITPAVVPATIAAAPSTTAPAPATKAPCPPAVTGAATKATITLESGGAIVFTLRADKAPLTVANFVGKSRACFYDGLTFHRVEDWVVQGGDPLGNGTGGNTTLKTELSDAPFTKGSVGVARRADNVNVSNDAQFYICIKDCQFLNGQYTYFGQVTDGQSVAETMKIGSRIKTIRVD